MPSKVTLGPAVSEVVEQRGHPGRQRRRDRRRRRASPVPSSSTSCRTVLMSLLPTSVVRRSCTASVAMATDATRSRTVSTTRRATATGSVFVSKPTSTPSPATIANDVGVEQPAGREPVGGVGGQPDGDAGPADWAVARGDVGIRADDDPARVDRCGTDGDRQLVEPGGAHGDREAELVDAGHVHVGADQADAVFGGGPRQREVIDDDAERVAGRGDADLVAGRCRRAVERGRSARRRAGSAVHR